MSSKLFSLPCGGHVCTTERLSLGACNPFYVMNLGKEEAMDVVSCTKGWSQPSWDETPNFCVRSTSL